jgi:hypothetical protein
MLNFFRNLGFASGLETSFGLFCKMFEVFAGDWVGAETAPVAETPSAKTRAIAMDVIERDKAPTFRIEMILQINHRRK